MAQTTRTFVAVAVPDSLGEKLVRLQGLLAAGIPNVRWVATLPFHLTLAFLGDVADRDLNAVCRAVSAASGEFEPFDLRLEGLGVFPDAKRPSVFWVGVTGPGCEPLRALQAAVAEAVAGARYPADEKRFLPHVTLGRLRPGKRPSPDVTPLLNHYRTWSAGSFLVAEAVTFASTSSPEGPVYAPLGRAPLSGGKDRPSA